MSRLARLDEHQSERRGAVKKGAGGRKKYRRFDRHERMPHDWRSMADRERSAVVVVGRTEEVNPHEHRARFNGYFFKAFPAFAAEIAGIPRIVDGDAVEIGKVKIRLSGIDAPETDQICLDTKGEKWACGIAARDELIRHSNGQIWKCTTTGTDRCGRSLANCFIEGECE